MIEYLLYDLNEPHQEVFYFSQLSTLEVTCLLDETIKINSVKIVARDKNEYLEESVLKNFKTIEDFNRFFINNRRYYLDDCELALEDDMEIHSHDDGEVSVYILVGYKDRKIIRRILDIKGLNEKLMEEIMKLPGHYFSICENGKIASIHKTFDDYLNRNK